LGRFYQKIELSEALKITFIYFIIQTSITLKYYISLFVFLFLL
jgi:hypothetical protein